MINQKEILTLIDVEKLLKLLLPKPWHEKCEIIPHYIPEGYKEEKNPDQYAKLVIRYNDGTEHPPFLRIFTQSGFCDPNSNAENGLLWDIYGDDFKTIENAILALRYAPEPKPMSVYTFSLNI